MEKKNHWERKAITAVAANFAALCHVLGNRVRASGMFKFLSDSSCVDSLILTQQKINITHINIEYGFGISTRFIEKLLFVLCVQVIS